MAMILTSCPSLIASVFNTSSTAAHVSAEASLVQLQSHLNLTRRCQRLFLFLTSFQTGWHLFVSTSEKNIETWLDIYSKTLLGIFGMIESVTLLDLLQLDQFMVFGPERTASLNVEAQKIWFVALYLSAMSCGIKLVRMLAYRAVPPTGTGFGTSSEPAAAAASASAATSSEKPKLEGIADEKRSSSPKDMKEERERRKGEQKAWMKKVNADMTELGLKLVSDLLDLVIPASIVGWIQVEPGVVGVAMLCSTITSSLGIWDRCRRQLESSS